MHATNTTEEAQTWIRWKLDVEAHGDLSLFGKGDPSVLRLVQSRTSMGVNRYPKHNRVAKGINNITNIAAHVRQCQLGSRDHRLPVGKDKSHQRMLNRQTKRKVQQDKNLHREWNAEGSPHAAKCLELQQAMQVYTFSWKSTLSIMRLPRGKGPTVSVIYRTSTPGTLDPHTSPSSLIIEYYTPFIGTRDSQRSCFLLH